MGSSTWKEAVRIKGRGTESCAVTHIRTEAVERIRGQNRAATESRVGKRDREPRLERRSRVESGTETEKMSGKLPLENMFHTFSTTYIHISVHANAPYLHPVRNQFARQSRGTLTGRKWLKMSGTDFPAKAEATEVIKVNRTYENPWRRHQRCAEIIYMSTHYI